MVRDRIQLPPAGPRQGGLLAAARPLQELSTRWMSGVTFPSTGCVAPTFRNPCPVETTGEPDEPDPVGDVTTWSAVEVQQAVRCSALYRSDVEQVATRRLDVTAEWAIGHVLQTGEHTDHEVSDGAGGTTTEVNPALVDAEELHGVALSPLDALACLEQAAADHFYGGPAFIHASPLLSTHLLGAPGIHRDGRRWITATGSVVVFSPGYSGTEMYVTGEVFAASGERASAMDVDREVNAASAWASDVVLAVFDPCWYGRVDVAVDECGGSL